MQSSAAGRDVHQITRWRPSFDWLQRVAWLLPLAFLTTARCRFGTGSSNNPEPVQKKCQLDQNSIQ
ncbi:hypothetical protein BCR44DRAFT_1425610 [Catenaria anguillulae PL171]|uniref:Uncharacterized protein n=1 Tax=Catenaria anguillulae PL171 TaxID=765915 RepID=A0A1Y2I1D8_9FUNG|nr:hypothetical protein BCR44DRAFT_1425610 [Catenaria anguillulae PL171]